MRFIVLAVLGITLSAAAYSQSFREMRRIDSLRAAGQLQTVISAYQNALAKSPGAQLSRYNLACAFAVSGKPDSAFKHLQTLLATGAPVADALSDADFLPLRKDKRWLQFETQAVQAMERQEGFRMQDLGYARKLWNMRATDQVYYLEIMVANQKEGRGGPTGKKLWAKKDSLNKQNQRELIQLVGTKGWPRKSQVGQSAAEAAFLVIQHSDSANQARYLPQILALCRENDASWEQFALMYDRLEMACNRPQRYGSQIKSNEATGERWIYRLEDPARVDEWRKEAGMIPMKEYAQSFGLTFP